MRRPDRPGRSSLSQVPRSEGPGAPMFALLANCSQADPSLRSGDPSPCLPHARCRVRRTPVARVLRMTRQVLRKDGAPMFVQHEASPDASCFPTSQPPQRRRPVAGDPVRIETRGTHVRADGSFANGKTLDKERGLLRRRGRGWHQARRSCPRPGPAGFLRRAWRPGW